MINASTTPQWRLLLYFLTVLAREKTLEKASKYVQSSGMLTELNGGEGEALRLVDVPTTNEVVVCRNVLDYSLIC